MKVDPIHVPQDELERIVAAWDPPKTYWSEFRYPLCAKCGNEITGPCFHVWHQDRVREIHLCYACGQGYRILVVVAAHGDEFHQEWLGRNVELVDTGDRHPTGVYLDAYRKFPGAHGYLFIQDSMIPLAEDFISPFLGRGEVVAWCDFPMAFDDPEQAAWVKDQFPGVEEPSRGIFGPVFYATRDALLRAEKFFPLVPKNRSQAQGTERAWAFTFQLAGIKVETLHDFSRPQAEEGLYPFLKVFAGRP